MGSETETQKIVVIVRRVTRTYGKNNNTQTLDHPYMLSVPGVAEELAQRLTKNMGRTNGKTSVSFAVRDEIPFVESVEQYDEQQVAEQVERSRERKRKMLNKLSAAERAMVGFPDPKADDETLDNWNPANVASDDEPAEADETPETAEATA